MFPHHAETIRRTIDFFARDPEVMGLILSGSIAHGFDSADSDVDIMILVSDDDHRERLRSGRTCFFNQELCTYPGGYIDGKYFSLEFLNQVRSKGSEPARFAFKDAKVLASRHADLTTQLEEAARYPLEQKQDRIRRFQAQFEAWHWYTQEARKRNNLPLLRLAVSKLTLFGGRIVLAQNELLYPYHKWFLRVLAQASAKPARIVEQIESLALDPKPELIDDFACDLRAFGTWMIDAKTWPAQFMQDSELNWLHTDAPIDDL